MWQPSLQESYYTGMISADHVQHCLEPVLHLQSTVLQQGTLCSPWLPACVSIPLGAAKFLSWPPKSRPEGERCAFFGRGNNIVNLLSSAVLNLPCHSLPDTTLRQIAGRQASACAGHPHGSTEKCSLRSHDIAGQHASCPHQTPTWQKNFHRGEAVLLNACAQAPKAAPAPGKDATPAGEHHGMRASAAGLGDPVALQATHLGWAQLAAAGLVAKAQSAVLPPAPGIHLCRAARSSEAAMWPPSHTQKQAQKDL